MFEPELWLQLGREDLETRRKRMPDLARSLQAALTYAESRGLSQTEAFLEEPYDSAIFAENPAILQNCHVLNFFLFGMRLVFCNSFSSEQIKTILMIYLESNEILQRPFWACEPFLLVRDEVVSFAAQVRREIF